MAVGQSTLRASGETSAFLIQVDGNALVTLHILAMQPSEFGELANPVLSKCRCGIWCGPDAIAGAVLLFMMST